MTTQRDGFQPHLWTVLRLFLLAAVWVTPASAHGRMTEPPSRASMFRFGFKNPPNYNDNQLFCGGSYNQWSKYGGKCGVCGDNFAGPREHEAPTGKYANGIIVRTYKAGTEIPVRIHLTANHKGYFEFRLCVNDDPKKNVTHECFDKHLLRDKTGTSRFEIVSRGPEFPAYQLKLPPGVRCAACVLQWKYNTGNSWGNDFDTGKGCIGCGPQEQFYACADVAIGHDGVDVGEADREVEVPDGDVDERTAWVDEAARDAAKDAGNCKCTCAGADLQTGSNSAARMFNGFPFAAIVLFCLIRKALL